MTVNQSIALARRISGLSLREWVDRPAHIALLAKLFVDLTPEAGEIIARILMRYGIWRHSAFIRICKGLARGNPSFEALCESYASAEIWDHQRGRFVPLGKQSCACCKGLAVTEDQIAAAAREQDQLTRTVQ